MVKYWQAQEGFRGLSVFCLTRNRVGENEGEEAATRRKIGESGESCQAGKERVSDVQSCRIGSYSRPQGNSRGAGRFYTPTAITAECFFHRVQPTDGLIDLDVPDTSLLVFALVPLAF